MSIEEDLEAEGERLRESFELALAMVKGGLKLLVANGILPLAEHQHIALRWGLGEISGEDFVAQARAISEEHGSVAH